MFIFSSNSFISSSISVTRECFSNALTERIFPDSITPDSSVISIPFSPRGTPTDSVKFLEEISPPPRSYFRIQESDSFESLVRQSPRIIIPIPEGIFTIGPHYFDLHEIRPWNYQPSRSCIPVFIPNGITELPAKKEVVESQFINQ